MKKGLLFILLAAGSVCLSAQEKEGKTYTVETNRFGANWFISGGVGGQVYFGDNDSKADFGKRIAPAVDVAVGKWFTPSIGLRVAYNGLQAKGATPNANDVFVKGGTYSNGYHKQKWNLANFHGDVLFNLSNMFCGYKEDRVYSLIPYVGAGLLHSWSDPHFDELGVNAGLINRFRLSSALDLNVELRGVLMKDAFGGKSKEGMAGATVGLTYKFKKRGWKGISTVPMVPESQLDAMRDRMNSLKNENDALKRDLVDARNKKPEVVVQKEVVGVAPRLVVVFNIGKSSVSKREYLNIESVAKAIKAGDKTYTVCGYADKGTGSAAYNLKLSKKRAEAVRDVLVKEFGVSASQLKVDYKGGVSNMFYNDASLSRVAIVEE
ncbi:OmpA family protein [Bacteroides reticulotermitis]|uniref:OmpA family protein n=1 Tax=Bacteroides reticulotermitis TaxID=1133319 RepID=UPI001DD4D7DE|nr:OmpA family protein [Bacteroides reticulotermitis]